MSETPKGSTNAQLRWTVTADARPGEAGAAVVTVLGTNAMAPALSFDMAVDWTPGAEAPDVEGRALIILSLLFKELADECERVAGAKFNRG
jgi:hypothetical protein